MLIDWFTVGAQALNFVVLVWLMKRFLYQPVLGAIAAREKRIANQIADAAAKEAQATTERKTFEDKNNSFDQQRADLLKQAQADALVEGKRLADQAETTATALAAKRQQALASQAEQLQQLIAGRAAHEVFAVVRKTLADLANVDMEARIAEVFEQHLRKLPDAAKDQFAAALKQSTEPAQLRTHFELPKPQQTTIQDAINVAFSTDVPVNFSVAANAVCGIELSVGGQKIAWTIDEYLRDLERNVGALLVPATKPVVSPSSPDAPQTVTALAAHDDAVAA